MENKIEDLIRDDFRKREIQPNVNSFERLNAKLEAQTSNKRKRIIGVLAYAASFIGLIFILQSVFKNDEPVNNNEQVITNIEIEDSSSIETVNIKDNGTDILKEPELPIKNINKPKNIETAISIKENLVTDSKDQLSPKKPLVKELITIDSISKENIVFSDTVKKWLIIKEVTEEELDALLLSANQSLPKNGKDSISINAQSMLYEIEVEINKPLPEKVLLTLKTGTTAIKELVRPNEKENKKNK